MPWAHHDALRWVEDTKGWMDEWRTTHRKTEWKRALVDWLSSLRWTHIYHQTFHAECWSGTAALSLGSRFLADVASSIHLKAALLVAERHPLRKSRKQSAPLRHIVGPDGETMPDGQQGRLFHLHGLLAWPSALSPHGSGRTTWTTTNMVCSREWSTTSEPLWRMLKEKAYRNIGIARSWPLLVGHEIAATVYAVKYILKGMREWPEAIRTYPDSPTSRKAGWIPCPTDPPPMRDDWTILTFAADTSTTGGSA